MSSPASAKLIVAIEKGQAAHRELKTHMETILHLPRRKMVAKATGLSMDQIVSFETHGTIARILVMDEGQLVCCDARDHCSLRIVVAADIRGALDARMFGGYHPCA